MKNTAPTFTLPIDGKVTTDVGGVDDYGHSVTVQADGKILVSRISDIRELTRHQIK